MKKETPRSSKRRAGLADGFDDSGASHGMPTTGRDQGKAQSERTRRGLRHIDPSVASGVRLSGAGSRNQMGQKRRLGSGQQDRGGHWDQPGQLGGAGRPMPSLRLSPTSNDLSQQLRSLLGGDLK